MPTSDGTRAPMRWLLAVEVADTTLDFDLNVKTPLYAKAGIREVWVVALGEEEVHVYRRPAPGGYGEHTVFERGALPGDSRPSPKPASFRWTTCSAECGNTRFRPPVRTRPHCRQGPRRRGSVARVRWQLASLRGGTLSRGLPRCALPAARRVGPGGREGLPCFDAVDLAGGFGGDEALFNVGEDLCTGPVRGVAEAGASRVAHREALSRGDHVRSLGMDRPPFDQHRSPATVAPAEEAPSRGTPSAGRRRTR